MVERYPLPAGVDDAVVNQTELAAALDTSMPTVQRWLADTSFPIIRKGGHGRSYELQLSHCFAWKMHQDAEEELRRSRTAKIQQQMRAHMLNLGDDDEAVTMTARQRKDMAEADFAHSRAAHERRQLVRLEDVHELLEYILQAVRESHENLADTLERELQLTPAQVQIVSALGRDNLSVLAERIEREQLEERDVQFIDPAKQLTF